MNPMSLLRLPYLISFTFILITLPLFAQRGTGSQTGMARSRLEADLKSLTGTVEQIKIGPCEKTTGKSAQGVHLILQTSSQQTLNLHLGPESADAVQNALKLIKKGSTISTEAFTTPQLQANAYIVKDLKINGETVSLRNDQLRPLWAGKSKGQKYQAGVCN